MSFRGGHRGSRGGRSFRDNDSHQSNDNRAFRGRGGSFRGGRGRGNGLYFEDRRGAKRSFEDDNGNFNGKQFREEPEEIHPELKGVKDFLSQMKAHWRTQKMDKDEEEILINNVLKQTIGKEELLTKSEAYHLNCNVAEFLSKTNEPDILARFMRAFNVEKTQPQHKTIKIYEALVDGALEYFKDPKKFSADDEDDEQTVDYNAIFGRWLHCLGLFVIDNIERYFHEETMFTQHVLCMICGKKFQKNIQSAVETETIHVSDKIDALRNRYFDYLTKEADLKTLITSPQARFVVAASVVLAAGSGQKKAFKRFVKLITGENAESVLLSSESFIVVDSIIRNASAFDLHAKCSEKILELADKISEVNPGIVTGMIAGLKDKDEFVELYEKMADKLTLELLTKNAEIASACSRFDMKQNDFIDRLYAVMKQKETEENNFIFLVRNLGLALTFKAICGFKANQKVLKALDELSAQELLNLACSTHVNLLEFIVSSETIGEKVKLKMLTKLNDKLDNLATDKFGSRLMDAVIVHCQVKTIKILATELIKNRRTLMNDRIGKFVCLHWGLKYFEENNKEAWSNVINNSKERKKQKLLALLAT